MQYVGDTVVLDETLTASDFLVTAYYENDTQKTVNASIITCDTTHIGETTAIITYSESGITQTYEIPLKVYFEEDGYYVLGMNGDWGTTEYAMSLNAENTQYTEYMITGIVAGGGDDEIKVVYQNGTNLTYYSTLKNGVDSTIYSKENYDANIKLNFDGSYDIYFDTSVNKIWLQFTVELVSISAEFNGRTIFVGDKLENSDFEVYAHYSNETSAQVEEFFIGGFNSDTTGEKNVTITYTEGEIAKTFKLKVNVEGVDLASISASYEGKTLYVGDELDESFIDVLATYTNGTHKYINEFSVSGFSSLTAGNKSVTVTYLGKTTTVIIPVNTVAVASITAEYKGEPIFTGGTLSNADIEVIATNNNGTIENITNGFTVSGFNSTYAGDKTVTVSYNGVTTTLIITVVDVIIERISATYNGTKIIITEELNVNNITVTAHYSDGTTDTVTDFTVSEFDSSTAGQKTVTITYEEQTTTLTITVSMPDKLLTRITASYDGGRILVGDDITINDFTVMAYYDDTSSKVISNATVQFDTFKVGTPTAVVSYTEYGTTQTYEISLTVYFENDGYYILGINNDWGTTEHQMTVNTGNSQEMMFTGLAADGKNDAIKIVKQSGDSIIYYSTLRQEIEQSFRFDAMGNIILPEGKYDLYFNTSTLRLWISTPNNLILTSIKAEYDYKAHVEETGKGINPDNIVVTAYYDDEIGKVITDYTLSGIDNTPGVKTVTISYTDGLVTKTTTVTAVFADKYIITYNGTKYEMILNPLNQTEYMYKGLETDGTNGFTISNKNGTDTIKIKDGVTVDATVTGTDTLVAEEGVFDIYYDINTKELWIENSYKKYVEVITSAVNLRSSSNTNSSANIITSVELGTLLEYVETDESGMYKVMYNGSVAYVSGNSKYTKVVEKALGVMYYVRVLTNLNIRSLPSTDSPSKVLRTLELGDYVTYLGKVGDGWYITRFQGGYAYISAGATYTEIETMEAASKEIESIIELGADYLGVEYVFGAVRLHDGQGNLYKGFTTEAFDCSSFMQYIFYYRANINLGTYTGSQIAQGTAVSLENMKRGDIMFYAAVGTANVTANVSHVAMYLGKDSEGRDVILHTAEDYSIIEPLEAFNLDDRIICVKRFL